MEAVEVKSVLNLVPELLDVPYSRIWTVYDTEADVLYLNFKKPSHADDSEFTDDDLIIRYEKGAVIGITVLNASRRGAGYGRGVTADTHQRKPFETTSTKRHPRLRPRGNSEAQTHREPDANNRRERGLRRDQEPESRVHRNV